MGVRLFVEALDHAPATLISEELLLLLIICEDANDETRQGWPGMPLLMRRSRKSESTVRRLLTGLETKKAIRRLNARRVQPGAVPVVAHRGHRTTFYVEPMAPESSGTSHTEALTHERHSDEKGAHARAERRSPVSGKALTRERPSPHVPSSSPHPGPDPSDPAAVAAVVEALRVRTGVTVGEAWAIRVAAQLLAGRGGITAPARWLTAVIQRDTNPQRLLPTPDP